MLVWCSTDLFRVQYLVPTWQVIKWPATQASTAACNTTETCRNQLTYCWPGHHRNSLNSSNYLKEPDILCIALVLWPGCSRKRVYLRIGHRPTDQYLCFFYEWMSPPFCGEWISTSAWIINMLKRYFGILAMRPVLYFPTVRWTFGCHFYVSVSSRKEVGCSFTSQC